MSQMQINEQKKDRFFRILTVLLIIIIIILLFFSRLGKINNYPVPTGNVDVFDIDVDIDYAEVSHGNTEYNGKTNTDINIGKSYSNKVKTETSNSNNVKTETSDNNQDIERKIPPYDKDKDKDVLGRVYVDDKQGNYIYQQNLNIFNNAVYQYTDKIAPGVSNTYHFVVHNSSEMNLKYYVEMYENSEYQVNLKYRLKRNNNYVIGNDNNWVTADELKTAFQGIKSSSSDSYSLDWKWFDNDDIADTKAGKNMTSLYKLNIRFYFEAADA